MEKKVKLMQTLMSYKDENGVVKRKIQYSVKFGGILRTVYLKPKVRTAGFELTLTPDLFQEYFQFEVPNYSGASNDGSEQ